MHRDRVPPHCRAGVHCQSGPWVFLRPQFVVSECGRGRRFCHSRGQCFRRVRMDGIQPGAVVDYLRRWEWDWQLASANRRAGEHRGTPQRRSRDCRSDVHRAAGHWLLVCCVTGGSAGACGRRRRASKSRPRRPARGQPSVTRDGSASPGPPAAAATAFALSRRQHRAGTGGTVTVAARTVTVMQESGCTFSLSATSVTMPGSGGVGTVSVSTAGGCPWSAVRGAAWITITDGASGSGSGNVQFAVEPNGTVPAVELSPSQILRSRLTSNRGQISIVASSRFPLACRRLSSDGRRADQVIGSDRIGRGQISISTSRLRSSCSWVQTSPAIAVKNRTPPSNTGIPSLKVDGLLD